RRATPGAASRSRRRRRTARRATRSRAARGAAARRPPRTPRPPRAAAGGRPPARAPPSGSAARPRRGSLRLPRLRLVDQERMDLAAIGAQHLEGVALDVDALAALGEPPEA